MFPGIESNPTLPLSPHQAELARRWTADLLAGLDWNRILELARALASAAGFETSAAKFFPDGSAEFLMEWKPTPAAPKFLVRLAGWNKWMASPECIIHLDHELKFLQNHRGIFIAPGGFSPSALNLARQCGIETVDAETLAARLNELPAGHQSFYFTMDSLGNSSTPSCPHCLRPLQLADSSVPVARNLNRLTDVRYDRNDIVADPVVARRIEVLRHCEVQFLREVHTRDLIVHGVASGDFVCQGGVLLNPGAILFGNVAARSIVVRPGAALNAEARILDGTPESVNHQPAPRIWKCTNSNPLQGCRAVEFNPHG